MTKRGYRQGIRLLPVLLLAFVLAAAPARGGAPFGATEERAYAEAAAYWGAEPIGCQSIERTVVPLAELQGPDVSHGLALGRATEPAPGASAACVLLVAEGLTITELCPVMHHEYGHLLGYGHDDEAMRVDFSSTPGCVKLRQEADREIRLRQHLDLWREHRSHCYSLRRLNAPRKAQRVCWANLRRMRLSRERTLTQ